MRLILTILLLGLSLAGSAQNPNFIPNTQKQYTVSGRTILFWCPDTAAIKAAGKKVSFLFSTTGNSCNDSAGSVNQGPARRIRLTTSGVHRDSFAVVTYIRTAGENGSASPLSSIDGVLDTIIKYCSNWVDTTRFHFTGLSQGAIEEYRYLSNWGPVYVGYTPKHRGKFKNQVFEMPGSFGDYSVYDAFRLTNTKVAWGTLDGMAFWQGYLYDLFALPANYNYPDPKTKKITLTGVGHDVTTIGDTLWSLSSSTANGNTWLWLLSVTYGQSNASPIADAGNTQTLSLGTTSTTINGSSSYDPDGSISSYSWSRISGPNTPTIVSPSSVSTSVTGMVNGVYRFRLQVTDNNGATASDTVSVAIVGPRYQLTMDRKMVYKTNGIGFEIAATNLIDNDTTTSICPGFAQSGISLPTTLTYELPKDSLFNNMVIAIYNGPTADTSKLRFKIFDKDFTDSITVLKAMTINSWNYLDSNITKGIHFNAKYIVHEKVNRDSSVMEMRVWATRQDTASWLPPAGTTPLGTFEEFVGSAIEGSEPDSLFNSVGIVRLFFHRWYTNYRPTYNPSFIEMLFSVYGDARPQYQAYRARGLKISIAFEGASRAFQPVIPSDSTNYGAYTIDLKYKLAGSDGRIPASWLPSANDSYMLAAFMGRNTSASIGPHSFKAVAGGPELSMGNNYADIIEAGANEWNAYWNSTRMHTAPERAARISAEADGHMNTMGLYAGIKNADPTMKIYSGAIVGPDTVEIGSDAFYIYRLRGRNNDPRDGYVINEYPVYGGNQQTGSSGITAGQYDYWEAAKRLVRYRDLFMPGRRIVIGEKGYDKRQNTQYSAKARGSIDSLRAPAVNMIQHYHIARAAGIDGIMQYKSIDNARLNEPTAGGFATSGKTAGPNLSNPDSAYYRWPLDYYMSTMLTICKKYDTKKPDMVQWGDSTGLTHVRYNTEQGTDTITSVLWMGTNNDSYQNVTLNIGQTILWAEKVTNADKDKDGVHSPIVPVGNTLPVGSVGEDPVYVRYVVSQAVPGQKLRGIKFKAVRSTN